MSRTTMLRPRRSAATPRCIAIELQSAVYVSAAEAGFVVSVMVVVVVAAVRAIVIASASAAIAIAPMIAIPTMIAIPIARHAHHAIAIAIRTTAPVWPPMKANAAAPGDQRNIARGSR
jgi:hypothetical protein